MNDKQAKRLTMLKEMSKTLYSQTDQVLIAASRIMECGNKKKIGDVFDRTHQGYVVVLQQNALVSYLIMGLTRLHDKASGDRACIPQAFVLLEDKAVRARLLEEEGDRLKAQYGDPEAHIRDLEKRWAQAQSGDLTSWLNMIRDMRDSKLAHNMPWRPIQDKPTYDALFNSIDATLPIVEGLANVTGVNTNSFNGVAEIWDMRADLYWNALMKGGLDRE